MKIFKYQIRNDIEITMPKGARILCVQEQYSIPSVYALVDTSVKDNETRKFAIYGTEDEMRSGEHAYIDTFQMHGGQLVFHVFEILKPMDIG